MKTLPQRIFKNVSDGKFYQHFNDELSKPIDFKNPIDIDLNNYEYGGENVSLTIYNLKEEISKKQLDQGNKKTADFLKEAFCIDGESNFKKLVKVEEMTSLMFELTDTKRGKFYVTISK